MNKVSCFDHFQQPVTKGPSFLGIVTTLAVCVLAIVYFVSVYNNNQDVPDISTSSATDFTTSSAPVSVPFECLATFGCSIVTLHPNGPCSSLGPIIIPYGAIAPIPVCFLNADATRILGTVILAHVNASYLGLSAPLGNFIQSNGDRVSVLCGNNCAGSTYAQPVCNVQLDPVVTDHYNAPKETRFFLQNSYVCPFDSPYNQEVLPCNIANATGVPNSCRCPSPLLPGSFCYDDYYHSLVGNAFILPPTVSVYKVESGKRSNLALLGETGGAISLLVAALSIFLVMLRYVAACCGKKETSATGESENVRLD